MAGAPAWQGSISQGFSVIAVVQIDDALNLPSIARPQKGAH